MNTPFIIPHAIVSDWLTRSENLPPSALSVYAPGLMLSKMIEQPRGVDPNVTTYSIKHRDYSMTSFQI